MLAAGCRSWQRLRVVEQVMQLRVRRGVIGLPASPEASRLAGASGKVSQVPGRLHLAVPAHYCRDNCHQLAEGHQFPLRICPPR
jgi:hypothetical protein